MNGTNSTDLSRRSSGLPATAAARGRDFVAFLAAFVLALGRGTAASRRLAVLAAVTALTTLVGVEARGPGAASLFAERLPSSEAAFLSSAGAPTDSIWSEEAWPLEVDFDAVDADADDDLVSEALAPRAEGLEIRIPLGAEASPPSVERAADSSRYALEAGLPRGPPRRG